MSKLNLRLRSVDGEVRSVRSVRSVRAGGYIAGKAAGVESDPMPGHIERAKSLVGCVVINGTAGYGLRSPLFTVLDLDERQGLVRVERHHRGGLLDAVYTWPVSELVNMERVA